MTFVPLFNFAPHAFAFVSGRGESLAGSQAVRQVSVDSCLWDYRLACQHVVSTRDCVGFAGVHETVNVLMLAHCTRVFMADMPKANTFQLYIHICIYIHKYIYCARRVHIYNIIPIE